jgi:predicted DNA-binding transcriptional regulator YafY
MLTDRANAICLLRVLHEYSDEKHILPMREIIKRLYSDYGLSLDRRTVYGLVSLLSELGYDISVPEDNGEGYYLKHHLFTADEIRLLMDAVCSFQYLTAKQKENFVSKLQKFLCVYERHRYKHLIISSQKTGHAGYESRQVFRIIGQIDEAIQKKNKVIFAYPHYLVRRGAIRSRKEKHTVIPCGMLCENGHYYLHCKDGKDRHYMYRIDRMKDLEDS